MTAETEASVEAPDWDEVNQRYLVSALARVRADLERHASGTGEARPETHPVPELPKDLPPPALERVAAAFHLSPFERDILLLCASVELDAAFSALCGRAQGDTQRSYPTFSLALAALGNAHWSALTPSAPLRRWRLLEVVPTAGSPMTLSPLRIDERILHYLTGVNQSDERLAGLIEPLPPASFDTLVPSHRELANQIASAWTWVSQSAAWRPLPALQLCGADALGMQAIAKAACASLGFRLSRATAEALPVSTAELETLLRLWEREAILERRALLLDCEELSGETADSARMSAVARFIERVSGHLIIGSRERRSPRQRPLITYDVRKPTPPEQRLLWRGALGDAFATHLNGHVEHLTSHFDVSAQTISAASAEALGRLAQKGQGPEGLGGALWDACREQARPRLDNLAQRIEAKRSWDDLVLPEGQRHVLRDISAHVRQRMTVYEKWGFAARGERGLGISALFSGVSGTGKTMAAEVLAGELRLDLYRVDLSVMVSKYIGETEKNLSKIFDAAEEGGAILLFDEADSLFGKRSEVKDSHDRYANIEVSYLLQRMECYHGLAILTTNLKNAIDDAFMRRIRFAVQFPFPDATQRAEIWRRAFPADTPTEGLDPAKLARLNVTGGNIRNMALYSAFLAADAGEPVRMKHILRGARAEYAKLEKTLTDAETAGWL